MEQAASRLERDHVHSVYERIAPHFSDRRYRAWPRVRQFLLDQPPGSIVADVGCGNGKYLNINKDVFKLGCDVCRPLVDAACSQGHEVQLCDGLRLPFRDGCFDAVLSIAVIHHLSTKERRLRAITEMTRTLRVGGQLMIYVWAMEQTHRNFEKQDVFVPWNPDPPRARQSGGGADEDRKVKSTSSVADEEEEHPAGSAKRHRNQALWFFSRSLDSVFDFGSLAISRSSSRELSSSSSPARGGSGGCRGSKGGRLGRGRGLIKQVSSFFSLSSAGGSGKEEEEEEDVFASTADLPGARGHRGGSASVATTAEDCGSLALPDLVPYQEQGTPGHPQGSGAGQGVTEEEQRQAAGGSCLRYYHVFMDGELAELIESHVEGLHVIQSYYDHANWCVVAEKVQVWKI